MLDRLFTVFVSSTSTDLAVERQRLTSLLLGQRCVPLGMEYFPSAGRTPWLIMREAIQSADFCIFVVAGRYGSISDDGELSWTHREFREARRLDKPIGVILHASPDEIPFEHSEMDRDGRERLAAFRDELEAHTVCSYFRDLSDFVERAGRSVTTLKEDERAEGWVRAGSAPVHVQQESDFDRIYEIQDVKWSYRRSADNDGLVDGRYTSRRVVRANGPDVIKTIELSFGRATDLHPPFRDGQVRLRLGDVRRSGAGGALLLTPRKREGPSFAQDVSFTPPLAPGEVADFTVTGELEQYKFAFKQDLVQATLRAPGGPRAEDWASRQVRYPTHALRMEVFLPDDLLFVPRGPMIGRTSSSVDEALSSAAREGYMLAREERDGVRGAVMRLHVDNPQVRRWYRLGWSLPERGQ